MINNKIYGSHSFSTFYKGTSTNLKSIIIGLMLGDGSLYKSSPTSNTRLEMSFGEKYKEFAESLEGLFKDYINNSVKGIKLKVKNKEFVNYRLKTRSLPYFNPYYDMFYKTEPITGKSKKI